MALSTIHLTDAPAEPPKASQPFQLRGTMQTILCMRLLDLDADDWHERLLEKVAHAPDFFRAAPVLLDIAACVGSDPGKLAGILDRLRDVRLVPVGIQNGNETWNEAAIDLGLAIFSEQPEAQARQSKPVERAAPKETAAAAPAKAKPAPSTRHIGEPVRGGQQLVSDGDMVVTAPVSPGAEVAAMGNLHVYAPLRGRAFAGVDGNEDAMIFCDALNAELVSVAGVHMVNEEFDANLIGKRCRIFLERQELKIEPLR